MRDYFQGLESADFQFFRIPTALIKNKEYKGISTDAKLLYGLLLDRMSLSIRNDWRDARGRVYIIYTTKGVSEDLGCCQDKACKLMAELERAGLIERRRLGQGKPSRIYVKQLSSEVGKSEFKNTENTNSALDENRILNFDISESNHIEINHTNYIHTNLSSSVADGLFCREIDGLFCRSSPDIIVRRRCVLSHKRRGWLQPSPSFRYSRNLALQDELYHPVINNGPAVLVCVDKRLGTGPVNQSRDAG